MSDLMRFLDEVTAQPTPQDLIHVVQKAVAEYGVMSCGYAYALREGKPTGWGTSSPSWRKTYFDKGLSVTDPGYRRKTRPTRALLVQYDKGYPGLEADRSLQVFWEELRGAGRTASLFVPDMSPRGVASMSALNLVVDTPERHLPKWAELEGRHVRALAAIALHEFSRLTDADKSAAQCPLTERERQVLARIANGQQIAAIAYDLSLSEKTIEYHAGSLRKRLGAKSTAEAVAIATRNGWI